MTSKTSRTTNFNEQEKLLLAELGKDFPEVESKGYDSKTLTKKAKAWKEILTRFNSQIPNGIKRDLSQLQGCWRRLKLQSKKGHDLHRRETRTCEVDPSLLAHREAIGKKGAGKVTKKEDNQKYCNFQSLLKTF